MCIIAIKPKGLPMISDEIINEMFMRNHDGAGIMFLKDNGMVHIEKGFFTIESVLDYLHENELAFMKTDVVLHFRIGTSGKLNALNCHPYSVWSANKTSCDVTLGVAHNGILDSYGWKGNDEINDTQAFIKDLRKLPHNFLKNTFMVSLLKKAIGSNKFAFMDKDGIHTIGNFIEDNGYYYSNDSYKPVKVWNYPQHKTGQSDLFTDFLPVKPDGKNKNNTRKYYESMLDYIWGNAEVGPQRFTSGQYEDVKMYISNICRYDAGWDVYFDNTYSYILDDDRLEVDREYLAEYRDDMFLDHEEGGLIWH